MAIACVLFDHDDTLLPTFELRARMLERAVREVLGREVDGAAFFAAAQGRNLDAMAGELTGDDPRRMERLIAVYREHYYRENRGLAPYAGIRETLAELARLGVPAAVVTSKLGRGAREELRACGLLERFACLVGEEDVLRPKPAPEPLLRALAILSLAPSAAIMVGDTAADVLGARAAGVRSAGALWGTRDADALRALRPDHLLEQPLELLELLELLGQASA